MKRFWLASGTTGAVIILSAVIAFAAGILFLPSEPVVVDHGPWLGGLNSTLDVFLSQVGDGFDVSDGRYNGWCLEDNLADDPASGSLLTLMDSTDPSSFVFPCENFDQVRWDRVNYLLNNKQGGKWDQQLALWEVALTNYVGRDLTGPAIAMKNDAEANGNNFVPGPGQIVAVALCADGLSGEVDKWDIQDTIIEVPVPSGCTPGYWKQEQHFFAWGPTGYSQSDLYGEVFPFSGSEFDYLHVTNMSLLEALWTGGGKEKALYRHATAALLNAANPNVAYFYTVDEVLTMVQEAYDSQDFNHYKDMLEKANQMGCPLDNGGFSDGFECGSAANWSSVKN